MKTKYYIVSCSLFALVVLSLSANIGGIGMAAAAEEPTVAPRSAAAASLPAAAAPAGSIVVKNNGVAVATYTVEQLKNYTANGTIPVSNYTGTINSAAQELRGVNPLKILELAGLNTAWTFELSDDTGYKKTFNVSDCIMADKNYYKNADGNATMLVMSVGDTWLSTFDAAYGNFWSYGDGLTGQYKVKNITIINVLNDWNVKVTVNGTTTLNVNKTNFLTVGNNTTYDWGYKGNTSWPSDSDPLATCKGTTIASIIKAAGVNSSINYTVSFIAVDGYGTTKVFTKTQIENGFTGDEIANGSVYSPLSNEGKQAILMDTMDGKALDYASGPYWLIFPGAQKGNYIKEVVEIRITLGEPIESSEPEPTIDGYNPMFIFLALGLAVVYLKKSRK
jgi:hypothetical protein